MPKFSVIIPVYSAKDEGVTDSEQRHYRAKQVQRAIKSVINQQYPDWELVIVEDVCTDETPQILEKFAKGDKRIKIIHQVNSNRAIARNAGMDAASGEWLCWLDCDDEYVSHYLRELYQATKEFPDYKIFNFGSIIYWPDHRSTIRPVFSPAIEGEGHEWFRSGQIGAGSFIFRRDLWLTERANQEERDWLLKDEKYRPYRIPDVVNPYQFAADSHFPMKIDPEADHWEYTYTENPDGAFQDGVYRHGLSLGNPWGEDALEFYLLTRDNHSKPLDVLLYIQYPRAHEEVYEHFGEIYEI